VFVFKRGAGPFYRVAIGVYGDADSAGRVKDELERQGFEAILRRWLPE
jgi:cell division protein FtsN